jgi:hypothetical protein
VISVHALRNNTTRPGVVLGGGPSLIPDWTKAPAENVIHIAVNHHALKFAFCSYLVFMDDPRRSLPMMTLMNTYQGVKVSRLVEWTDVDLHLADSWDGLFSSQLAVWFACWLGCNPVILCGMDCYQNPRPPEADIRDAAYTMSLAKHLESWQDAFHKCVHPERIRAVSGPLVEIFGAFR